MHDIEHCEIPWGRISLTIPEVKISYAMAGEMESQLANLPGVIHVRVNPLTGNVLVLFDPQVVSHYHIFAVINDLTYCVLPH